jgi:hypothetical protein
MIVVFRPEDKMPVVWHQTITADSHGLPGKSLFDDQLKRLVVGRLVKQTLSPDTTIENGEHHPAR